MTSTQGPCDKSVYAYTHTTKAHTGYDQVLSNSSGTAKRARVSANQRDSTAYGQPKQTPTGTRLSRALCRKELDLQFAGVIQLRACALTREDGPRVEYTVIVPHRLLSAQTAHDVRVRCIAVAGRIQVIVFAK
jgi:hypothetical protein